MAKESSEEKGIVQYRSRDDQEIKLSFSVVRKFLVSGHPEYVTDQEIVLYMGMCKARGLNPFKKDCYLIKYTQGDPAATIVSIDYYRSRAKAQPDCTGWECGIIVKTGERQAEYRKGAVLFEGETLMGGWFRARPKDWTTDLEWAVSLKRYIKTTKDGRVTRFWSEENQPEQIAKVAESQGLRRAWPDEFAKLYIKEEISQGLPMQELEATAENGKPALEQLKDNLKAESDKGPPAQPEPPQEEPEPGQPGDGKRDPVDDLLADIESMSTRAGIDELNRQLNKRLAQAGIKGNDILKITNALNAKKKEIEKIQTKEEGV